MKGSTCDVAGDGGVVYRLRLNVSDPKGGVISSLTTVQTGLE